MYSPVGTVSDHVILPLDETSKPAVVGAIEYVTVLFVAFCGATVAVNCLFPAVPATALEVLGDTVTPVTGTVTPRRFDFPECFIFNDHETNIHCRTQSN